MTVVPAAAAAVVVRVGVGVLVQDPQDSTRILGGIRKNSHGSGTIALPGGHLELYESWSDCAQREVLEECDLILDPTSIVFGHVTNDPMPDEGKHYVTIFMLAKCTSRNNTQHSTTTTSTTTEETSEPIYQQPKTMEPHKCEGWNYYSWDELETLQKESKLFGPLNQLLLDRPSKVLEFLKQS